jgi:hypothetical protein
MLKLLDLVQSTFGEFFDTVYFRNVPVAKNDEFAQSILSILALLSWNDSCSMSAERIC